MQSNPCLSLFSLLCGSGYYLLLLFSYHVDLGVFVSTFSNSVYTWVLMFLSCLIRFRLGSGCFYIVSFCLDLGLVVVDCKVFLFYILIVLSL
jgi:hypothetical protein